jgi:hypothetical protein
LAVTKRGTQVASLILRRKRDVDDGRGERENGQALSAAFNTDAE